MSSYLLRSALARHVQQLNHYAPASSSFGRIGNGNAASSIVAQHPTRVLPCAVRALSSAQNGESKGMFEKLKGKMDDRSSQKEKEKYAEQLQKMANTEVWNLNTFAAEIDASMPGWKQYIPGVNRMKQVKEVKETQKLINALKNEIGGDASPKTLETMNRKEKLKVSLKAGITVDDLDAITVQFGAMDVLHRLLRYMKLNGLPIPTDEDSINDLYQLHSEKVLTRREKKNMQKRQFEEYNNMRGI